jgi:hypothetical protein
MKHAVRSIPVVFGFVLFAILFPATASSQSTFGSIRGVATDSTGASVPSAAATLRSLDQSITRSAVGDSSGAFTFENLAPGKYVLTVAHSGFATTNLNGIALEARQNLRVTVTLDVSTESTTVDVTAGPDQINTEDAAISDSKNNALITQLPLNNRASTTSPLGALTLSANVQQDSSGYIALGGASSSMINFSVDGISTANVRQNGALQDAYPSQEGIAAVKVTAFNNSAEFSQVGDVTFTTRSGGNTFHGSLFEYLQNDMLDANPYGFSGKAPKHFNTFGGSLGGPVTLPRLYNGHGKTFFFFDYEGNRRATAVLQQFLVPSAEDRSGNLATSAAPPSPPRRSTPRRRRCWPTTRCPTSPGSPDTTTKTSSPSLRARMASICASIRPLARATRSMRVSAARTSAPDFANPLLPDDVDSIHNRSLLVSDTFTITPRLLNEARYGFTNVTTSVNFPIQGSAASHATESLRRGHQPASADPRLSHVQLQRRHRLHAHRPRQGRHHPVAHPAVSDNLTYTRGKHTLKGGIDIRRVRYFDLESFAPEFASDDFGSFTFDPTFTGNAFGDFLVGEPTTLYFAVSSPDVGGTATQYSFFAQDEFQLTSRLTLSYGLRWQVLPSFQEDGGNLANFDQNTNSIVVPDNLAAYLTQQNIVSSNLAFQQSFNACNLNQTSLPCTKYVTASQDGLPAGLRQTYKGNFQPRVAFAYRPFNDTKTVVRGGFGIYTMTNLGPLSFNNSGNPTSNLHVYSNAGTQAAPLIQFPNTAPPSVGVVYGGGGLDQGVDPHFRDPQSNQWSLTVERQLSTNNSLRASYVGMHTYRLSITEDLNQIPASTNAYDTGATAGTYVDTRAPYQNWTTLYSTFNAGESNYRALELEATHHMARGLYYDANYTLAQNQADNQGDNPSGFAGEVNYGVPIADRFHIHSDYGNQEGTRRHRMLLTGIYELPFGEGRAMLNHHNLLGNVLGGWNLNTVTLLETGPWLTPSISPSLDQSNTNVVNRGAFARPDVVSTNFYKGQSRTRYFNPAAFAIPAANAGRFGNAGVGILQGPGTASVSLGVAKVFPITESIHLRFESTFTNVLNHTNFAPPATQIDNTSTFGQLTAATVAENAGNRTGQLALRLDF